MSSLVRASVRLSSLTFDAIVRLESLTYLFYQPLGSARRTVCARRRNPSILPAPGRTRHLVSSPIVAIGRRWGKIQKFILDNQSSVITISRPVTDSILVSNLVLALLSCRRVTEIVLMSVISS
jgi:hypothetical protein